MGINGYIYSADRDDTFMLTAAIREDNILISITGVRTLDPYGAALWETLRAIATETWFLFRHLIQADSIEIHRK